MLVTAVMVIEALLAVISDGRLVRDNGQQSILVFESKLFAINLACEKFVIAQQLVEVRRNKCERVPCALSTATTVF